MGMGWSIPSARAPTSEQRSALIEREQAVSGWLAPAGPDRARVEIAALLGVMASRAGDETDKRAMLEIYVADLAGVPLFALRSACRAYRSGAMGDGQWAPPPGVLRQTAEGYARALMEERGKLRKVLGAKIIADPVIDPERREAVVRMARGVCAELRAVDPVAQPRRSRLPTKEEAQAALEIAALEIAHKPPPKLSDELRRKMGLLRDAESAA